jgi:hypothetical protein
LKRREIRNQLVLAIVVAVAVIIEAITVISSMGW